MPDDVGKALTLPAIAAMKLAGRKIAALTAYDACFARVLDEAGIDCLLVGDSLGMVIQGHATTLPVTVEDLEYHVRCVARTAWRPLLVADLPFMSYATPDRALQNSARLIRAGAQMVKLEGAGPHLATVRHLAERNISVCGHLGLLPQSIHQLGGYTVQARDEASAERLLDDALSLQEAGASLLVLECVPAGLAHEVTHALGIPTIGIGAGPHCDGQVLVLHDMLGITPKQPRFCRDFLAGTGSVFEAVRAYAAQVHSGEFPGDEHGF